MVASLAMNGVFDDVVDNDDDDDDDDDDDVRSREQIFSQLIDWNLKFDIEPN